MKVGYKNHLARFKFKPTAKSRVLKPQQIIWREWRNCNDEEYAKHLFELVAHNTLDGQALVVLGTMGAALGAIGGGLFVLLILADGVVRALPASAGILAGLVVGGVLGLVMGWGLKLARRTRWDVWLPSFIPSQPVVWRKLSINFHSWYFILTAGLSSGLGLGITGTLFFGQSNRQFYSLAPTLAVVFVLGLLWEERIGVLGLLVGMLAGFLLGLLFGLGFAQIVGMAIGPLDVLNSARLVGLTVGLALGWYCGRWAGMIGLLTAQIVFVGLVLPMGFNLALLSWLVGVLLGGMAGSYSQCWRPLQRPLGFADAYAYRWAYLWWHGRPPATQVEAALRSQASEEILLKRLNRLRKRAKSTDRLITDLLMDDWQNRFVAQHRLVALGGEVVFKLTEILRDRDSSRFYPLMRWLIRSISYETTTRLAEEWDRWVCPNCLTFCGPHIVSHWRFHVTYYGCRTCQKSRELLDCFGGVVALLDAGWRESSSYRDQLLCVNALRHERLFDFNQVEIVNATDEQVERFVMRVGNDTDPMRRSRYPYIRCTIARECGLSENTLRVLDSRFGQVERAS